MADLSHQIREYLIILGYDRHGFFVTKVSDNLYQVSLTGRNYKSFSTKRYSMITDSGLELEFDMKYTGKFKALA